MSLAKKVVLKTVYDLTKLRNYGGSWMSQNMIKWFDYSVWWIQLLASSSSIITSNVSFLSAHRFGKLEVFSCNRVRLSNKARNNFLRSFVQIKHGKQAVLRFAVWSFLAFMTNLIAHNLCCYTIRGERGCLEYDNCWFFKKKLFKNILK